MGKLETLKSEIKTIDELKDITSMLEQIAARDITQMRSRILESRQFFQEAWRIYRVVREVSPTPPDVMNKHLVVIITLNWGMAGSLLKKVTDKGEELYQHYEADLLITGKMGQTQFADRDERTIHFFNVPKKVTYSDIAPLREIVAKYSQVHIVYPRYEKLSKQVVATASLLVDAKDEEKDSSIKSERFIIEPDIKEVANYMNKAIVGIVFYHYFAEALLAYSAAQMVAMRSAHDNAKDQEKKLTFNYNKARRELVSAKLRELYENKFISEDASWM